VPAAEQQQQQHGGAAAAAAAAAGAPHYPPQGAGVALQQQPSLPPLQVSQQQQQRQHRHSYSDTSDGACASDIAAGIAGFGRSSSSSRLRQPPPAAAGGGSSIANARTAAMWAASAAAGGGSSPGPGAGTQSPRGARACGRHLQASAALVLQHSAFAAPAPPHRQLLLPSCTHPRTHMCRHVVTRWLVAPAGSPHAAVPRSPSGRNQGWFVEAVRSGLGYAMSSMVGGGSQHGGGDTWEGRCAQRRGRGPQQGRGTVGP
jgi:hypothetical protein